MFFHEYANMLIGGAFVAGEGAPETVIDPRTGLQIASIAQASTAQVDAAIAAARKAFATLVAHHARGTQPEAAETGRRHSRPMLEEFARLEARNTGKPQHAMLADEMPAIVDCFRFFAGAARTLPGLAAGEYLAGYTSMLRRDPIGVVGSIAPWNYPLMMAAWKLAPAIAAGNTVLIKPSENTPLTLLHLGRHIARIFPEGVVNIVLGTGVCTIGQHMIDHPDIDMISLTGDIGTGRKVLSAAAASIKRTHLELGGKAPVLVFDDADLSGGGRGACAHSDSTMQARTARLRVASMPARKSMTKLVADLGSAVSSLALRAGR